MGLADYFCDTAGAQKVAVQYLIACKGGGFALCLRRFIYNNPLLAQGLWEEKGQAEEEGTIESLVPWTVLGGAERKKYLIEVASFGHLDQMLSTIV